MHRNKRGMIIVIKNSTVTVKRKRLLAGLFSVRGFVQPFLVEKGIEKANFWLRMEILSWHNSCYPDGQGGQLACTPGK